MSIRAAIRSLAVLPRATGDRHARKGRVQFVSQRSGLRRVLIRSLMMIRRSRRSTGPTPKAVKSCSVTVRPIRVISLSSFSRVVIRALCALARTFILHLARAGPHRGVDRTPYPLRRRRSVHVVRV